ncbi:MAG: 2-C-methyl-D-erythritol 2,4-cyclodiphosphate synthase [Acidobacteria bacterium RIFCSPLOWO2_12_FULL_60_22]|nr:MAG: 2-C-methyl-D-erythritol 2,4-cyclodiphosphate synthase [Acidobacteria bacterium RIFCSPLOWO2_12_FULL_60_22]
MGTGPNAFRCGIGYDSHLLVKGRKLLLGGVEIPSPRGLRGHSDGDVLSHAIVDALLGAAGLGDMGNYFPDTDPRWKNASSLKFLDAIRQLLTERRLQIVNIDTVVILDEPKLGPHMNQIKEGLAAALGINKQRVNVKAKTSEGTSPNLAAAHAVVLLVSPVPV